MASPADRKYSDSHEWHKQSGEMVTIGVTKFAVDELTDVTYVELKPVGTQVKAGGEIGEIESVKATSEVYSAVGGEIVEINQKVVDDPAILNKDSFEAGWLVKMKVKDASGLAKLMDGKTYDQKHAAH